MKKIACSLILFIIVLGFIGSIYAITGSIGNARMILRVKQGDLIEKSILVKNVNDVQVNIKLSASGDLEKDITILDDEFSLQPGEEKKANFEIKVIESGTFENKINIQFNPIDEGNGVGLSSTIIVIAEKNSLLSGFFDDEEKTDEDVNEKDEADVSVKFGRDNENKKTDINDIGNKIIKNNSGYSKVMISSITTMILFLILLGLLVYSMNKKKNKDNDYNNDLEVKQKKSFKKNDK